MLWHVQVSFNNFLYFIGSLLSLKKSKLLQLLSNEEEGISGFPESLNGSSCSNDGENDPVRFGLNNFQFCLVVFT